MLIIVAKVTCPMEQLKGCGSGADLRENTGSISALREKSGSVSALRKITGSVSALRINTGSVSDHRENTGSDRQQNTGSERQEKTGSDPWITTRIQTNLDLRNFPFIFPPLRWISNFDLETKPDSTFFWKLLPDLTLFSKTWSATLVVPAAARRVGNQFVM